MKRGDDYSKRVLVTGAGAGIGRFTAEYLAANGFSVYASARQEKDLIELGKNKNIKPIRLDVTRGDQIGEAVDLIAGEGTGLYGLVNNAGIVRGGPLAVLPEGLLQETLAVNLLGVHEVTKAFFPLLHRVKGRIVIIGSVMGFIAYPFVGPYCVSKQALEAYADCLRRELLLTGVKVSLIQPGFVRTALAGKSASEFSRISELVKGSLWEPYRGPSAAVIQELLDRWGKGTATLTRVAQAVLKGLTEKSPRSRYLVTERNLRYRLIRLLPGTVLDMYFKRLYRSRPVKG